MSQELQDPWKEFVHEITSPADTMMAGITFSDDPDQAKAAQENWETQKEIANLIDPSTSADLIEVDGQTMTVAAGFAKARALIARRDTAGARHLKRALKAHIGKAVESQVKRYKGRKRAGSPAAATATNSNTPAGGGAWEDLEGQLDDAIARRGQIMAQHRRDYGR